MNGPHRTLKLVRSWNPLARFSKEMIKADKTHGFNNIPINLIMHSAIQWKVAQAFLRKVEMLDLHKQSETDSNCLFYFKKTEK